MSATALSPSAPISSGEIPTIDFERAEETRRRHALIVEYLLLKGFNGLVLQDPANFAWATCGGDNTLRRGSGPLATLLITPEARVVLCNNVDSGQMFDRELMGLGFLLKERPWTEAACVLCQDVCRGRKVGSDTPLEGTEFVGPELAAFRRQITRHETEILRQLGRDLTHAIEATARNFEQGATEAEIAGHLAHRLIKHSIEPVRLQVLADAQGWRYRHWSYGSDRVERHCVLAATGKRDGLHVSATRTVCLGAPSGELQEVHHLATLVQTTGMYFTRAGWGMAETWKRVARIYEKFGVPDEWRYADQAEVIGYLPCEVPLIPTGEQVFEGNTAICWHPSVRSGHVGDTMIVRDEGFEILTPPLNWPVLAVGVKGHRIERPGILIREP